jgi:hypothetical protein
MAGADKGFLMPIYDNIIQAVPEISAVSINNTSQEDYDYAAANISDFIKMSGKTIEIFRVANKDYDATWGELREVVYHSPVPIDGFYKPSEVQAELKKWGVDSKAPLIITFSISDIETKMPGNMLNSGDVIKITQMGLAYPEHYRINSVTPTCMYRYRWYYYKCYCDVLPADYKIRTSGDMGTSPLLTNPGVFYEG